MKPHVSIHHTEATQTLSRIFRILVEYRMSAIFFRICLVRNIFTFFYNSSENLQTVLANTSKIFKANNFQGTKIFPNLIKIFGQFMVITRVVEHAQMHLTGVKQLIRNWR